MKRLTLVLMAGMIISLPIMAQKKKNQSSDNASTYKTSTFSGLKWRSIGPAFTSGRIADFAVNPDNTKEYYVAVASGHVWKTVNSGITFSPVFDKYGVYSMGVVTMDPNNHNVVWVGTGENNHQRALGYGNGVWKSLDGGQTWKNMGLKESRQIGGIVIDPRNSDVVFIAAEGSAWGPGGDRGLYKTTDGGNNWTKVLEISENTGINNVVMDPCHPDILYATSEQRRRHVHTKIGGGPESAIHKSTDGGETWKKLTKGLPTVDMGGMGIAVSPANPDIVYVMIEARDDKGGFFRSTDRGESWEKISNHYSKGQYFGEIFCDPVNVDVVYSMEVVTKVTRDGGKTWSNLGNNKRHVDDHAMWIDPCDPEHFLIGGDGGIFESFDAGKNYHFKSNLPVTQFYRVNVDNDLPFYNVYGGTQDNNSMGGPSRNTKSVGVPSDEWYVTWGGDGFWVAIDPENPDIVYCESQYGHINRYDRKSGENLYIKPRPGKGEKTYKWNWDTPFIISPHSNTRLYIAANKVFRSDNRGEAWEVISDDITAQVDRNTWPVMGQYWSYDAVAKDVSTSQFGMAVSLVESPVKEDLLFVGTDDGVISVTENAGQDWRQIKSFPGVPEYTYVTDIMPDKFNENIIYAAFNNHKRDDFKPYILKSTDKGASWVSISSSLPDNGPVHTIEQDFINPNLLFTGTEFGAWFSPNGGQEWIRLKSGLPSVAVEDMVIQERESDLVLATFGRGFYILDDYSPLREVSTDLISKTAHIFPVKDALMYVPARNKGSQGSTYFVAANPPFGATFTYYFSDSLKTLKQLRHQEEKKLFEAKKPIPQPTVEQLRAEEIEDPPFLIFTITDADGYEVRRLTSKPKKGINRITWDLKYPSTTSVSIKENDYDPFSSDPSHYLALPGTYYVSLSKSASGTITELIPPVEFNVVALNNTTLPAADREELVAFHTKVSKLRRSMQGAYRFTNELNSRIKYIRQSVLYSPGTTPEVIQEAAMLEKRINDVLFTFNGQPAKASWEEVPPAEMPLNRRLSAILSIHSRSTSNVTKTETDNYEILLEEYPPLLEEIKLIHTEILNLEKKMEELEVPWTPGRIPEW